MLEAKLIKFYDMVCQKIMMIDNDSNQMAKVSYSYSNSNKIVFISYIPTETEEHEICHCVHFYSFPLMIVMGIHSLYQF